MRSRSLALSVTLAWLLIAAGTAAAEAAGLTEAARLRAVYDDILDARFDRARQQLAAACPPAPREACLALTAAAVWWQILLDLDDRSRDHELETAATTAIDAADAWTRREPTRAEAWFYLAGAYAPLVQLRVFRGQRLAAARDGNRIRSALERARELDPRLDDALFGIGLYHYYADVAPAAARMLRWLLFLPGGNRQQGLAEILAARDRGALLRGEADFQLHWLYLWYEQQPQQALARLQSLRERFPHNPLFIERIAEVEADYLHDHPASAATWQQLLTRATDGTVASAPAFVARAQLGLAAQLDALEETDIAIAQLRELLERPGLSRSVAVRAFARLGRALDRVGDRDAARAAYREVLARVRDTDRDGDALRADANAGLARPPDAVAARAYRQSLAGWRALAAGDVVRGTRELTAARAAAPDDPTIAYRLARAAIASGDLATAQRELERVVQMADRATAVTLAAACVDYATLLERSGATTRAIELYERARSIAGSDPRTRAAAVDALKRVVR